MWSGGSVSVEWKERKCGVEGTVSVEWREQ